MKKVERIIKRIFDILFASLLLVLLSPLMLITAVAIKLDSPGPVIFKQERLGKDGKTFTMYKFRSMVHGAEKMGMGIFTAFNDPRITRVGRFLRQYSIDELPQLWNIIKGEMSFVGPRPPLPFYPKKYEEYEDWVKKRFEVLPGITGWAQVHGRNLIDWYERFKLDVWYVENWSLALDAKIILLTIVKVLKKEGVYDR